MATLIKINEKVRLKLGIQANKRGYTGKTDYIIGTVKEKIRTRHSYERGEDPNYSTAYLIQFDDEYFLERSDQDKKRFIYNEENKYIKQLIFCVETNTACDDYLKPIEISRI